MCVFVCVCVCPRTTVCVWPPAVAVIPAPQAPSSSVFERHVGGEGASAEWTLRRLVACLVVAHAPQLTFSRVLLAECLDKSVINASISPALTGEQLNTCAKIYRRIDALHQVIVTRTGGHSHTRAQGFVGFVDIQEWVHETHSLSGLFDSPFFVALCDVVRTRFVHRWDAEELIVFFYTLGGMTVRNMADFVFDRLATVTLAGGEMALDKRELKSRVAEMKGRNSIRGHSIPSNVILDRVVDASVAVVVRAAMLHCIGAWGNVVERTGTHSGSKEFGARV